MKGSFSWPEMHTFWVSCPSCGAGMHLLASEGSLTQIKIISAPGPEWEEICAQPLQGLTVRADPGFLHVWAFGNHYEFPVRT